MKCFNYYWKEKSSQCINKFKRKLKFTFRIFQKDGSSNLDENIDPNIKMMFEKYKNTKLINDSFVSYFFLI